MTGRKQVLYFLNLPNQFRATWLKCAVGGYIRLSDENGNGRRAVLDR